MKSRLSLIFAALVVLLFAMVWVIQDRKADLPRTPVAAMAVESPIGVQPAAEPAPVFAKPAAALPAPQAVAPIPATPVEVVPEVANRPQARPLVHIEEDGTMTYTARSGDTVSELAIALLGADSKSHRDAIIAANPSLTANPDRVLTDKTYSIRPPTEPAPAPASDSAKPVAAASTDTTTDQKAKPGRVLKYTAQPGDNVSVLASDLLGGDTKDNRDAIINRNASLQQDPDKLVAGKTYKIVTTSGLAFDPAAPAHVTEPATKPEADDAARLSVGRQLQYTARPGDTVSKLALVLLGSDTKANRDAIIESNQSLRQDPDHLVAGQTYWIAAPKAEVVTEGK